MAADVKSLWQTLLFFFFFLIYFWLCHVAHGILVPQPETELTPPESKCKVLTTRPPGKSQVPVADILNPEGVLPGLKEDA